MTDCATFPQLWPEQTQAASEQPEWALMSARRLAQTKAVTTPAEVEEELSVSSKDGRESVWDAMKYATWCVHADARQCLTQFLDHVTGDSAFKVFEPREVLVRTLSIAVIAAKPGVADFILTYARSKWTGSQLCEAAACLAGECRCKAVCCNWPGYGNGQQYRDIDCYMYPDMDITQTSVSVVELAYILNRREAMDKLLEFVETFGVTLRQKLYPHCSRLKESKRLADQLLCAVSIEDEQQVLTLLSQGADPNASVDEFGRSALMHAVLHGNEKLVKRLMSAGAFADHVDQCGISVQKMVIYANAANLVRIFCCDEQGKLCNGHALFYLGTVLNNTSVLSKLCDIGHEIFTDRNPVDWKMVISHGSAEMLNMLKSFVLKLAKRKSGVYMLKEMIEGKRADLLPVLLSYGNFFDIACSEVRVHPQNVPMLGTCSVVAARVLIGEGVPAEDAEEGTAIRDAATLQMPVYCSVLLQSGMNKFASSLSNLRDKGRRLRSAGKPQKLSFLDQCAVLIDEFFPSLYEMCLAVVRKSLQKPVGDFVDSLPLPMREKTDIVFVQVRKVSSLDSFGTC